MKSFFIVRNSLIFLFLLLLCSCSMRSIRNSITLPTTAPLSRTVIGYGVVSSTYSHVLDKRGGDATALGLLRRGSIVEILERRPLVRGDAVENWVYASGRYSGWILESEVNIFNSLAQAKTAAATLQ